MRSSFKFASLLLILPLTFLFLSCDNKKTTVDTEATPSDIEEPISADVIENPTKLAFATDVFDFGDVKQGDKVKTEFAFTNTGDNDLIISGARGSCGCTVPEWPKEPIKPGGSGVIKVQFDSKNKKGPFNKTVTVTANTVPSDTKILIKGVVLVTEK